MKPHSVVLLLLIGTIALVGAARTTAPVSGYQPTAAASQPAQDATSYSQPAQTEAKPDAKAGVTAATTAELTSVQYDRHEPTHYQLEHMQNQRHGDDDIEHFVESDYHNRREERRYKEEPKYEHKKPEEYNSRDDHGLQVINLEIIKKEGAPPMTPTLARGLANTTQNDTRIDYGVICRRKKSAYGYTQSDPYGEDSELLIKSKPIVLDQLGSGSARLEQLTGVKAVKIDKQRGMQVAKMRGTLSRFSDAAQCNPLLTHTTEITYRNTPVYLMFSKIRMPLDAAMLKPLLPILNAASGPHDAAASAAQPLAVNPAQFLPSLQGEAKSAQQQGADAAGAQVSVAAANINSYGDDDDHDDTTLCGLTLVAKGPVTLKTRSGSETWKYRGTLEKTLLWTNGVVSLPGFVADAMNGANGGQLTQSLFSTRVTQQLTSTVSNGKATSQVYSAVGNSAGVTAIGGGQGSSVGGNVNITQTGNTVSASAANALLQRGDDITDNTVNVVNDLGSVLEQYGDLLKTICKNHKDLPVAKPGNMRLDVSFVSAEEGEEPGSALTEQQVFDLIAEMDLPALQGLTEDEVLQALFGTTDVSGLTEQDVLDALFG